MHADVIFPFHSRPVEPVVVPTPPPPLELLTDIPDHRYCRGVRHRLRTRLAADLAAVLAGATPGTAITE